MKKAFLALCCSSLALLAYVDSDLDGVEDPIDRCPNTSMTELVDATGCPVESLVSKHRFDIVAGVTFDDGTSINALGEGEDTALFSLQADYYYDRFSVQFSSGRYEADSGSGWSDTLLAGYYQFEPTDTVLLRLGAGVLLPTHDSGLDNEAADYQFSANISAAVSEKINLFGGFSYTLVNDDDVYGAPNVGDVLYQDTQAIMAGVGYAVRPNLYTSLSYNRSDSIYRGVDAIESATLYGFYGISDALFVTVSYSAGMSDSASDNAVALRIGRYF